MMNRNRYARQTTLPEIGTKGQERIEAGKIAIIGLGALGSSMAELLARSGVGHLRIVDRDFVELTNLHRQSLYREKDVGKPKAEVAAKRLTSLNSTVTVDPRVVHVNAHNIEDLLEGMDLLLDGTDNMQTRFIMNDACVKHRIPWIYSSALRTYGMTLTILPEQGPCLRCLWKEKPPPGSMKTCATAGILPMVPRNIANLATTEAVKYLVGEELREEMVVIDLWNNDYDLIEVSKTKACPACDEREFPFLEVEKDMTIDLCGRDAIQVVPPKEVQINFDKISQRYEQAKRMGEYLMKIDTGQYQLSLFKDGRLIVSGTSDPNKAISLYAEYVGR